MPDLCGDEQKKKWGGGRLPHYRKWVGHCPPPGSAATASTPMLTKEKKNTNYDAS